MASPDDLSLGDYARQAMTSVRGLRHRIANASLAVRENHEKRVRDFVGGVAKGDEVLQSKTQEVASTSTPDSSDRWWYQACQDIHRAHDPADDPLAPPVRVPGFRGCLEAEVLAIEDEPPLVREDGTKALDPVCQLCLDGRNSGALAAAMDLEAHPKKSGHSTARFLFREVAGADLRVNIFDKGSARFGMGFEHQAYCGGVFVPLATIIQRATEAGPSAGLSERLFGKSFELRLRLALLPLDLLRWKSKLEPAYTTGFLRPHREHGQIRLRVHLTMYTAPLALSFLEPMGLERHHAHPTAKVGDPASVMQSAAASASRASRAVVLQHWLDGIYEVRMGNFTSFLLSCWWSYGTLLAPLHAWPLLLLLIAPLFMWKVSIITARAKRADPVRMYRDEVEPAPEPPKKELPSTAPKNPITVQSVMKEGVSAQMTVMKLVDSAAKGVGHLERLASVLTCADMITTVLCGLIALIVASALSFGLWVLTIMVYHGLLRYSAWFAGCCLLMPEEWLALLVRAKDAVQDVVDKINSRLVALVAPMWLRIPDGPESAHLALFERYVLVQSW